MFVDAVDPCLDSFEGLLVGEVECYDHSVCLSVELISDSSEPFLPSCVPNLDIKFLLSLFVLALDEVDSDGLDVSTGELLTCVLFEDGCLSHCSIS